MKFLYYYIIHIVLLLETVQCKSKKKEWDYLKPPTKINLKQVDSPAAILVEWNEGRSLNLSDPVTGYKVSIWEKPHVVSYQYELVNGFWMLHEVIKQQQGVVYDIKNHPFLTIKTDKNNRKALVTSIKVQATYLVQIQTLSKSSEGPKSNGVEIKIENVKSR